MELWFFIYIYNISKCKFGAHVQLVNILFFGNSPPLR